MNILEHYPALVKVELPGSAQQIYAMFIDDYKYQEAIWLLQLYGYFKEAACFEQWLQQYMSTANAVSQKVLGGGATSTYLVTLDNGITGVFKPKQYNPSANLNSEAAAYRLDQLLNLNIVPCTVIRKVHFFKQKGSFQYFVADAQLASSLEKEKQIKPATMLLLDFLMENRDRYAGNYMYIESLDKMLAIDNGWGLRGNGIVETIKGFCIDRRSWKQRWGQIYFPPNLKFEQIYYFKLRDLKKSIVSETFTSLIGTVATNKLLERQKKVLDALSQAYL
ncbi:MAG: hypothetical protein GQ583_00115 [Methyloprofundus sp.]|nr:hypothetical protein [Methyloprofundus sp.]